MTKITELRNSIKQLQKLKKASKAQSLKAMFDNAILPFQAELNELVGTRSNKREFKGLRNIDDVQQPKTKDTSAIKQFISKMNRDQGKHNSEMKKINKNIDKIFKVKDSEKIINKFINKNIGLDRMGFNAERGVLGNKISVYSIAPSFRQQRDLTKFLDVLRTSIKSKLKKELITKHTVKYNMIVSIKLLIEGELVTYHLVSKNRTIYHEQEINESITASFNNIILRMEEMGNSLSSSGHSFDHIYKFELFSNKVSPLQANSYIELPHFIKNKKACINPQNKDDNECFKWCMYVHQILNNPSIESKKDLDRISKLKKYDNKYDFLGVEYPMKIDYIKKFEVKNSVSINVFHYETNDKKECTIYPLRVSKNNSNDCIDLLYVTGEETNEEGEEEKNCKNTHYAYIKDLSKLLSKQGSNHNGKKYYCRNCLHGFNNNVALDNHKSMGCVNQEACKAVLPKAEDALMKFKNYKYMDKHPYVIYADFESILEKQDNNVKYAVHKPVSFCYYVVGVDGIKRTPVLYRGNDVIQTFLSMINKEVDDLCFIMQTVKKMNLSPFETEIYNATDYCRFCQNKFIEGDVQVDIKVRDHDHVTGAFRGAAHKSCNVKASIPKNVPVFIHNLKGYDAHLIVEGATAEAKIEVIANNTEKYMTIKYNAVQFKDSFQFLSSSLETLAGNLNDCDLVHTKAYWEDNNKINLVKKKGVFPYEWFDNRDKLNYPSLPVIDEFDNTLSGVYDLYEGEVKKNIEQCEKNSISSKDYEHANNVWNTFDCNNFGDYHDIYLYSDVLLLADVFETFRNTGMEYYNIDPAHYLTLPSFGWDALLNMSKIELQLLTNYDMYLLIERGIRGGMCCQSTRYAKANNKYMKDYDKSKDSSYLMYLDANNLYGYAMSKYLPYNNFKWVDKNNFVDHMMYLNDKKQFEYKDNKEVGHIYEVDLEYPRELHDAHNDYPLAPERMSIKQDQLSNYQKQLLNNNGSEQIECVKLIPNLNNKTKYVVHYTSLKLYLKLGLKLTKIHNIVSFNQKPWMKDYIDFNTEKRKHARNPFEKDFFKLMNNSVFGKTLENVRGRINFHLVNKDDPKKYYRLVNKPVFRKNPIIYNDSLVGIQLDKTCVTLNKPIYVGLSVLDISKNLMYEFNYNYIKPKYEDKAKVCYTDTDSLVYHIQTEDVYEDMKKDIDEYDFSDYPENHSLHNTSNKKVIGKMKDEIAGDIMTEFIAIRAKCYSYKTEVCKEGIFKHGKASYCTEIYNMNKGITEQKKLSKIALYGEGKKAKGIKKGIIKKKLTFDHFKECLMQDKLFKCAYNNIISDKHVISTRINNKHCLVNYDDKRYLLNASDSLAWGHKKISEM